LGDAAVIEIAAHARLRGLSQTPSQVPDHEWPKERIGKGGGIFGFDKQGVFIIDQSSGMPESDVEMQANPGLPLRRDIGSRSRSPSEGGSALATR